MKRNQTVPLTLQGKDYLPDPVELAKRYPWYGKFRWADIPEQLRATEAMVRDSIGASNPTWLRKHLTWRGCGAAVPARAPYWLPCSREPMENGYCKAHKGRAEHQQP